MTIAIRNTVRSAHDFIRWAARAETGEPVTYHIGSLSVDRATSPVLHLLAETVMIFAECGFVTTSQVVMRLPTGAATWYYASRTGRGRVPRSIMFDTVDAHTFRALQAVRDRDESTGAARAIRDVIGCSMDLAHDYLALLFVKNWIEPAESKGWQLSAEGLRMLT